MRNPLFANWKRLFGRATKPLTFRSTITPEDTKLLDRRKISATNHPGRRKTDRFKA